MGFNSNWTIRISSNRRYRRLTLRKPDSGSLPVDSSWCRGAVFVFRLVLAPEVREFNLTAKS